MNITPAEIPLPLRLRNQWVLWKFETRGEKKTKLPYQACGKLAESDNEQTWSDFTSVERRFRKPGYDGIGFVFASGGGLCGVDLDGCRDKTTGKVSDWAREIILAFGTYAEVSPTETGVKLFCVGVSPFQRGRRISVMAEKVCDKEPGIEVYDFGRYFAVTGWRLSGPKEPQECQEALAWLAEKYSPNEPFAAPKVDFRSTTAVVERARKYVAKMPPAVSGERGHDKTFHVACVLVLGFGLTEQEAYPVIAEWNQGCRPPWGEYDLQRKLSQANKQPGERCYLRNTKPERWEQVKVPSYGTPPAKHEPKITILAEAAMRYLEELKSGRGELIELGLNDVDAAIGGGVERGEVVVIGARPSHGKSALALQCIHTWTGNKRTCFIASEEMSSRLLGKRTIQFVSDTPQEHWIHQSESVEADLKWYAENHSRCYVAESCGTAESVVEQIEKAVVEHEVQTIVVDYLQLLRTSGKSQYEQVTNASMALKAITKKYNLVTLLLCQLGRQIETRKTFEPMMSDLKDSGQIEQDADVILFSVWPHRIDNKLPAHEYRVYVAKNRNREILERVVMCRFEPSRQMLTMPRAKDRKNYDASMDAWNGRADVGTGTDFAP
jgi:KaiC/GvpD/RAD55 family RecA-like ATPase